MKIKYISIGLIAGIALALSTSAVADSVSKVGKTITKEYVIKLNGDELPITAVAFEGTSYAPVRAISEAIGLDVDFKNGEVILSTPSFNEGGEDIVEETYKGLKAISVGGEVYFSPREYNETFEPYGWGFDSELNVAYLALFEENSTTIVKKHIEINRDLKDAIIVHNGTTYINAKYYADPSDLVE